MVGLGPGAAIPWTRAPLSTVVDVGPGRTAQLAAFVAERAAAGLPPPVDHHARRLLLDHLAAVIAGSRTPVTRALLEYVAATDGGGESSVAGSERRLSPPAAALVNGSAAHGLEIDDGYTPGSVHPSAASLPAVLALAEALDADGPRLATAIAVAVETTCRLAAAIHPESWRRGFHNTPVCGVVGAACGAASLHGCDADAAASAIGVAASHAGGLFAFLGTGAEVKRLHAGKAARDGLLSVELARRGIGGSPTVLEDAGGFLHAFAGAEADPDAVTAELGERWVSLGTYVKPYPCCRHLHGAIDGVLGMRERDGLEPDAIDAIRVDTNATAARHAGTAAATLLDAQMSLPHAVAAALVRGRVDLEAFDAPTRENPVVRALAERVTVRVDPELDRAYPAHRPTRVTIGLRSGDTLTAMVRSPRGEPDAPVSDAELERKFHDLCDPIAGAEASERIIDRAWSLDDPRELFSLLRAAGRRGAPAAV